MTVSAAGRAHPDQRERILRLFRRAEIATTGRVLGGHCMLARMARIAEPEDGQLIDDWLYNMTRPDAARLAYYLAGE